jgi:hypothetical protein
VATCFFVIIQSLLQETQNLPPNYRHAGLDPASGDGLHVPREPFVYSGSALAYLLPLLCDCGPVVAR